MQIRPEQIKAFEEAALRDFEDRMVLHLAEFSPPLFRVVGEDGMRGVVRTGIGHASSYDITLRGPLRLYLEMMLLFGSHFDSDPQYPWAQAILQERDSPELLRADKLYATTCEYRQNVTGPDDAYTIAALKRLSAKVTQPLTASEASFGFDMLTAITDAYPEKVAYIGEEPILALIEAGAAAGRTYGFSSVRSLGLSAVLMFAFGHGCFRDPLYPWIGKTAAGNGGGNAEDRAKRLEKKAATWLEHVLANFDEGGDV